MNALTPTLDASRVRRCLAVGAVSCGLLVPLVAASDAPARSRLSRALLGGTNEPGAKQPQPDGIGSLGSEIIAAVDKAMNGGSASKALARARSHH